MPLEFRAGPLDTAQMQRALVDLVIDIFDVDLNICSILNGWHPEYRAFSYFDAARMIANVSIRPFPMLVAGRVVQAGQIHSVATRPDYRGRGLFHVLMAHVLSYAGTRYEALFLYTGSPKLYQAHGFRNLVEHRFRGNLDFSAADRPQSRNLSMRLAEDVALLRRVAAGRVAVSARLGLLRNEDVILVNTFLQPGWRLTYLTQDDAIIIWDRVGDVTRLLDIIAARIPAMGALATAMGVAPDQEIEVHFPPDRLSGCFRPVPHQGEEGDILMCRGAFDPQGPVMLPLTALS